ncbi:hypothetical protein CMV_001496 [Castanea mollissima]|uniref:Uncharacterized protein n=1 Tax=Castanea mollissima TaxID=60419 RepID=A0A8J4RKR2_9ROSI|nr:hypothetical protein CMV_001496 [Castanea mollissima]
MLWKPNLKSYKPTSFTKIENSANKLDLLSSGAKGKGRFLEEKSERQREDPNSPPHVKSEEVLDFDGRIDPKVFLDWLASLERYFDWHGLSNEMRGLNICAIPIQARSCFSADYVGSVKEYFELNC